MRYLREEDPEELRRKAEGGHPEAAYLLGCHHAMRIASRFEAGFERNPSFFSSTRSIAETDEEAIKWFLIAAKGGLAEGMKSV